MRQGNRLVTVPPQALGITSTTSAATPAATTSVMTPSTNPFGQTSTKQEPQSVAVRSMSSSTAEQLAEFDAKTRLDCIKKLEELRNQGLLVLKPWGDGQVHVDKRGKTIS